MENGYDGRSLADKFSELAVSAAQTEQSNSHSSNNHSNNNDSNLFQVLKAVEAAEATIKQQVQRIFLPPSHFLSISIKPNAILLLILSLSLVSIHFSIVRLCDL